MAVGRAIGKWVLLGGILGLLVVGGALIGLQTDGPVLPGQQTNGTTATAVNQPQTTTGTVTASATPTARGLNTVRSQYATVIERLLVDAINDYRTSALDHQSSFAATLDEVAQAHSKRMAETHRVAHTIYGETTVLRFERHDIAGRCTVDQADGTGNYTGSELELVGHVDRTGMGQPDIARALLAKWAESDEEWKLRLENAETLGVGIVVVKDSVYATVLFC